MAAEEKQNSRRTDQIGVGEYKSTRFFLVDTDDPDVAILEGPAYGEGHPTVYASVTSKHAERHGEAIETCVLTVEYTKPKYNVNKELWEWDFNARAAKVMSVNYEERQKHYPEDTEYTGTAIGANGDKVDGVNALRAYAAVTVTKQFFATHVNKEFRTKIYNMENTTNASAWQDWDAGEVLFTGANIREQGEEAQVTYNFLVNKNQPDFEADILIPDTNQMTITVQRIKIPLTGWQYLWYTVGPVILSNQPNPPAGPHQVSLSKTGIIAAHVAELYEGSDFALLEIQGNN